MNIQLPMDQDEMSVNPDAAARFWLEGAADSYAKARRNGTKTAEFPNEGEHARHVIAGMSRRFISGKYCYLSAQRNLSSIHIFCVFKGEALKLDCHVELSVVRIPFDLGDFETDARSECYSGIGFGEMRKFEFVGREGSLYLIKLQVLADIGADQPKGDADYLSLIMGIPLTSEHEELLADALRMEENPEIEIRAGVEAIAKKQDAFEKAVAAAVKKIKAKGLPADVEAREIEELNDSLGHFKDKHGL